MQCQKTALVALTSTLIVLGIDGQTSWAFSVIPNQPGATQFLSTGQKL